MIQKQCFASLQGLNFSTFYTAVVALSSEFDIYASSIEKKALIQLLRNLYINTVI